ncbi:MAG: hypothetical protein AB8G95_28290 [Anaerolineae bacterium]
MTYLKETLHLLYLLWFKPITFHHRFDVAGADPLWLNKPLLGLWRKKNRASFLPDGPSRRAFGQLVISNFLLMVIGAMWLCWLSDVSELSTALSIDESYWVRVAIGVGVGVTVGVAAGVAVGVAVGVAFSVAVGVGAGVAVGASVGVAGGVALVVAGIVAAGVAAGVAVGVAVGVAFSVAGGLMATISPFRLLRYLFWSCWSLLQLWLGQGRFRQMPLAFDELIYLPLPFFNRLLIQLMQADLPRAEEMLTTTASSTGQKWAVASAGSWWGAQAGLAVSRLADLESAAARLEQMSTLVTGTRRQAKDTEALLKDFSAVAQSLANLETGTLVPQTRLLALERNRTEIETLKARAGLLSRTELADMGNHWQRLIREHAQELEQMESRIITGAYQAGSALETGSQLFQGRTDLFNITGEVYADPNRAETLLLIGQQRMGKSSALYQMSDRIPDLHMMFVDCQGAFTGKGDELFAAGLTEAIMRWEKRRPGGIRMETLDIATIEKHPLHHLSIWLDAFADQTQGKRVLLCLDEFDKLVRFVAEGRFSWDVLGKLRGLSQSPGWMVLYSGQFELDAYSQQLSEYVKNVRRVRVSYLKKDEARKLIEEPVPEFGLTWEPDATEAALYWSGCQPFLVQLIGTEMVNRMVEPEQTEVTEADVKAVIPAVLDSGDYYFKSIDHVLDVEYEIDTVLREIAEHGRVESGVRKGIINRLISQEYIEEEIENSDGNRYRFRVPLLREWWLRKIADQ